MAHLNPDDDTTPVKESSQFKLSPSEIIYLKQLPPEELLEKFIHINEDFMTLKIYTRKQEDKIMRLQTKLRKLTSDLKGRNIGDKSESYRLMIIEHEEEVEALNSKISFLETKNKNLEAKLKVANVQLCAARKNKVPQIYRHVTPRIDSGIRRSRISKSLTNIHQAVEGSSRAVTPMHKRPVSKNEWFSQERESSNLSTPRDEINSLEISNQVRCVLEDARKKIVELETDQEQLLQQLSDAQQNAEDQEREYIQKIHNLEKEINKRNEECREKSALEQKEKMALIRSERQNRSSNARMSALSNHLKEIESKLFKETALKEEALDTVDSLKEEKHDQENQLKKIIYENEKLKDQIQELKNESSYTKKQLRQLETENERLTNLCVMKEKKEMKKQEMNTDAHHKTQKSSTFSNEIEAKTTINLKSFEKEKILILEKEIARLKSEVAKEREEKLDLLKEVSEEKENYRNAQDLIEELKSSKEDLYKALEKLKQEETNSAPPGNFEELKKSIEQYRELDKGNIYDKMAFRELQNQYMELQLIFHEKKVEFNKVSSLVAGHARTYQQLKEEKEVLKREIEQQKNEVLSNVMVLRTSLKTKEEMITRLEAQLLSVRRPKEAALNEDKELDFESGETLSLNRNHNVLELFFDKLNFVVPVKEELKTFVSWVMFIPVREPLQHTSIAVGSPAHFNHISLYKFKMSYSNFFLIKGETLKADIYYLLSNDHPRKIGECVISLDELLSHPQNALHGTVGVVKWEGDSTETEEEHPFKTVEESTIGFLHYSLKFYKSGEQYIAKFQKKLAEATKNSKLENGKASSDCQYPLGGSSVTSSPASIGRSSKISRPKIFHSETRKSDINVLEKKKTVSCESGGKASTTTTSDSSSTSILASRSDIRKEHKKESKKNDSIPLLNLHKNSSSSKDSSQNKNRYSVKDSSDDDNDELLEVQCKEEIVDEDEKEREGEKKKEISTPERTIENNFKKEDSKRKSMKIALHLKDVFRSKKSFEEKSSDTKVKNQVFKSKKFGFLQKSKKKLTDSLSSVTDKNDGPDREDEKKVGRRNITVKDLRGRSDTVFQEEEEDEIERASDDPGNSNDEDVVNNDDNVDEEDDDDDDDSSTNTSKCSDIEDDVSSSDEEQTTDTEDEEKKTSKNSKIDSASPPSEGNVYPSDDRSSRNVVTAKSENENLDKHQESHSETESKSSNSTSSISKSSSSNKSSSSSSSSKSSSMMKEMEYGTLKIEIVGLILEENTQIMRAPSIQYLIVDYFGFLDFEPENVETPKSLPKPKAGIKAYFNFMNQIKLTRKQRQMLDKLEKQDAEIKFHLSAEPSAESKDDEDIELARASLKIRSMIKGFKGGIPLQELEKGIKIGTLFILTSFENRVKNN